MQQGLFGKGVIAEPRSYAQVVVHQNGTVLYYPAFFPADQAASYFENLLHIVAWGQQNVQFYGKQHPMPRLTAWYGDSGATYRYSKTENQPLPWTPLLLDILYQIEEILPTPFNSVLLNRYRSGEDSVAWHADDEPELGPAPTIASVTAAAAGMKLPANTDYRVSIVNAPGKDSYPISSMKQRRLPC